MKRSLHALCAVSLAASGACADPDDGGVHVTVELEDPGSPAWEGIYFDHVTVTARGGGKTARVCLFPSYEVEQQIVTEEEGEDPCADLHTAAWTRVPNPDNWALAERARRVNFVFPNPTDVHVEATARLGGGGLVARDELDLRADAEYPSGKLELQRSPDAPVLPPDGRVQIVGELPAGAKPQEVASACNIGTDVAACPLAGLQEAYLAMQAGQQVSAALSCVGGALRIANTAGQTTCPGEVGNAGVVAWGTTTSGAAELDLVAYLTGHFAACKEGDPRDPGGCVLTTACTPPTTGFVVARDDCTVDPTGCYVTQVDFSVVPPLPVSANLAFKIHFPMGFYAVLFVQNPVEAAAPGACFFDMESLVVVAASGG